MHFSRFPIGQIPHWDIIISRPHAEEVLAVDSSTLHALALELRGSWKHCVSVGLIAGVFKFASFFALHFPFLRRRTATEARQEKQEQGNLLLN